MSLIQDALKRKSEEVPGNFPPVTPGERTGLTDEKTPKPFLTISTAVLIAGLIAVLAGTGIYLLKPKQHILTPEIKKSASVLPVANAAAPEPVAVPKAPVPAIEAAKVETVAEPVKKGAFQQAVQVEWPELNLTGIAQSGSQSIAVINGKMLPAGRKLGEVTVREVNQTDVVVEYRGERRILYINE